MKLTLDQFRETRQGPFGDVRVVLGDFDDPMPGYIYEGPSCISLDNNGNPYLIIANMEYEGNLEQLEEILYNQFYVPECT